MIGLCALGGSPACKGGGANGGRGGAAGTAGAGGAGPGTAGAGGAAGTAGGGGVATGAGGNAGGPAGHGGSGTDAGGTGGTGARDAGCGRAARTYTFARQKIASLNAGAVAQGIVLQSDGTPLLLYQDGTSTNPNQQLWAAHRPEVDDAGVSLSVATQLTRAGGALYGNAVVRGAHDGSVRAAYLDQGTGAALVRYIEWTGDFNQAPTDVVVGSDAPNIPYQQIGFDLDAQDHPSIAYFTSNNALRYAVNPGSGWQVSPVATTAMAPLSLTLDGAGNPIVFLERTDANQTDTDLFFTNRGPSGWSAAAAVDPADMLGAGARPVRDGAGVVEVFYISRTQARRAVGPPDAWNVNGSLPDPGVFSYSPSTPAVAFGAGGEIHVVLAGRSLGVLYGYYDGCNWSTQTVDQDPSQGGHPGIAIDAAGDPHISYQVAVNPSTMMTPAGSLWYAYPGP
jgi:hypothetical protein